ncbi:hypothetical protein [Legionella sp. km772]|uniref:hypothetical protein n=1 Tax=Legionella sp. km772 TaxID=2498111 RepID=UPI000F8F32AD|nr:hypothetical protein [Legionella sp. km772]RUR08399.1 hypothetical protein ELY15_10965 [Legionella sp. km772]
MTKTIEELRKILTEQETALIIRANHERLSRQEQTHLDNIKMRLADEEGMDELPPLDILATLYKKPVKPFEVQSANNAAILKIFENFEKEFGKENIKHNALHFPDNTKADAFFQKQASEGHAFLFQQQGFDNYAFSDGNGHYKMGSKEEIVSYCKKNSLELPTSFNSEMAEEQERSLTSSLH